MQTSNFSKAKANENGVAISRGRPFWYRGKVYEPLMPRREMLKMDEEDFLREYNHILSKLSPEQVVADVGSEAVLLCWEALNVRCHRRLVAEWLEFSCGLVIPEFGYPREVSIPFDKQCRKATPKPKDTHPQLF